MGPWDHLVEVLNFLMMSVVAPMHLEGPLFLESVLFLMVVHMDSSWVNHLAQMPLAHESFRRLHHKLNPQ
jgi:hypothetical protein